MCSGGHHRALHPVVCWQAEAGSWTILSAHSNCLSHYNLPPTLLMPLLHRNRFHHPQDALRDAVSHSSHVALLRQCPLPPHLPHQPNLPRELLCGQDSSQFTGAGELCPLHPVQCLLCPHLPQGLTPLVKMLDLGHQKGRKEIHNTWLGMLQHTSHWSWCIEDCSKLEDLLYVRYVIYKNNSCVCGRN